MQTKTKKIVLGMVSGVFGLCAVSGLCLGGALSKANSVEPTVITMEKGASLRFNAGAPALRYFATLSDVKDGADYGMLIVDAETLSNVSGDYHASLAADSYADVKCVPYVDGGKTYIRGALTGFSTENFSESFFTDYVAIGYEKVGGVYTYATVDETYGRSIVDAAQACDVMDKEWTAGEREAIDYFVSVADSQIVDDFTGDLTAYTAKNAKLNAWAEVSGNFDGAVATYLYTQSYEGITEVEFDVYASTYKGWFGVSFGNQSSVYRTPALFQNTSVGQHNAITTKVNTVAFDLSKDWVNFKFVIASATEATLFINGTEAYKFTDYAGKEGNNYFDHGRVTISSSNAENVLLIDNVKVTHSQGTYAEDFSGGAGEMLGHGNVRFVDEKVNLSASTYQGDGYFLYNDVTGVSGGSMGSYEYNYLKTPTYTGVTEVSVDVSVVGGNVNGNGLYVLFGTTSIYYPILKIRSASVMINSDFGTAVDINGEEIKIYKHDFTKETNVKIAVTGATMADVYLNGEKVFIVTCTNATRFPDLTSQNQHLWLTKTDYAATVKVDNMTVKTATATYTETFDTVVSTSTTATGVKTINYTYVTAQNITEGWVDYIYGATELSFNYDVYKTSNGLTVNQGYSVPETAEATDTVLFANVTLSGKAAAIVLGESASDKGLSLIVIENGKIFLRNVTDTAIVDGEAADLDITTAKSIAITMTAAGEVSVSVDGGEAVVFGTASYVGGNFSVLEVSGVNALNVTALTLKMQVYA